jgi:16S rRNA (adenine1518-N6/adenine1519-N6)-dimethyltransferase
LAPAATAQAGERFVKHRPKKRFGQNFLQDRHVVEGILTAADLDSRDRVLEIGPGLGALTERLLPQVSRLHVIEIDRDLAAGLQARTDQNLVVHPGDALALDWNHFLTEPPYKLIANLPYNISSQIVFKILDHRHLFSRLVLMFQKEVGERLCASPGGRDYGILSVLCQVWFDVRRVLRVPPGAFYPPPKVHSAVLCFDALEHPRIDVADEAFFRRVVKAAFAQRRKTLRNSLIGSGFGFEGLEESMLAAGIDPRRRAETLDLEEFGRLALLLSRHCS